MSSIYLLGAPTGRFGKLSVRKAFNPFSPRTFVIPEHLRFVVFVLGSETGRSATIIGEAIRPKFLGKWTIKP